MKKSLIALAVLAASGAAMAQSTVTLYGVIDAYVGSAKTDNGLVNGSVTQTVLNGGNFNGNRWGLKGTEDLGGGLKANFQLENGFNIDNGSLGQGGLMFGRQAWVGLSGGFGAAKVGRVYTAYDDVNGQFNGAFDSGFSPSGNVMKSTGYASRANNGLRYETPALGGLTAALTYGLGENAAPGVDAGSNTALNVAFASGPISASLGYQVEKANGNAESVKFTRLGAGYDLGMAFLKASYGKVENMAAVSGADATEYQLGVDVPVGAALTLSASYAKSDDNAKAGDASRKGFGIAAKYTLSKRTFAYAGYERDTTEKANTADLTNSLFGVGVQHRF